MHTDHNRHWCSSRQVLHLSTWGKSQLNHSKGSDNHYPHIHRLKSLRLFQRMFRELVQFSQTCYTKGQEWLLWHLEAWWTKMDFFRLSQQRRRLSYIQRWSYPTHHLRVQQYLWAFRVHLRWHLHQGLRFDHVYLRGQFQMEGRFWVSYWLYLRLHWLSR